MWSVRAWSYFKGTDSDINPADFSIELGNHIPAVNVAAQDQVVVKFDFLHKNIGSNRSCVTYDGSCNRVIKLGKC